MSRIYLDHNATTPTDARVLDAMVAAERSLPGNPGSVHAEGRAARRAVDEARDAVAALLGVDARGVVFCSGATEANNLAVGGIFAPSAGPARAIAASAIEHPSVLEPARSAAASRGATLRPIRVTTDGRIDLHDLDAALATGLAGVAVMAVNNETGVVQPVREVASHCAAARVPLHVDATQAPGRIPFAIDHDGITSAAISAHKFGGPKGVGALWLRPGTRITPSTRGGSQERDRRAGTENVAAIVGFGVASRLAIDEGAWRAERLRALEARFVSALRAHAITFELNGAPDARVPGTLSLRFAGRSGEALVMALDLLGVSVSQGSACSSGAAEPSHVLAAMGLDAAANLSSLRVSMSAGQPEAELDQAAGALAAALARVPKLGVSG